MATTKKTTSQEKPFDTVSATEERIAKLIEERLNILRQLVEEKFFGADELALGLLNGTKKQARAAVDKEIYLIARTRRFGR